MTGTETIDPAHVGLDTWEDAAILAALVASQRRAIDAVAKASPAIAAAASALAQLIGAQGRIVYVGAGSSGLLAAIDGVELLGTYGWPADRVAFVLASGTTLAPLTGGEEDDEDMARNAIAALALTPSDVVIAVAASGTTPYTRAATDMARATGALTIGIANNSGAPLLASVDFPVLLESGPEVIVGSTRMGAGTAQKAALNLISTLAMIRLGHVYDGLMVNLRADNQKLHARSARMLRHITGADEAAAMEALARADGSVKRAALLLSGFTPERADITLAESGGNLRAALALAS